MGPKTFIIAIVSAIALAAGILIATRLSTPEQPDAAFIIPSPIALPDFSLLDQNGDPVNAETFQGQWDIVFFGFTNCPDICPTTLQTLAAAKRELVAAGVEPLPRIVLVSVDPERDTPSQMGQYIDYFGAGNLGVTGELAEIKKLTKTLGIYFQKQVADGGNYGVDHSAAVLVFNPAGEFHALFSGPHVVANYVHDLPLIMTQLPLVATDVVITAPMPGTQMSAGYLSLTNNTPEAIKISRVVSAQFASTQIHESTLEDGVAKMRRISELVVPGHATVTLARAGKHLMLMRPTGAVDNVSLKFFDGDTLVLRVNTSVTTGND